MNVNLNDYIYKGINKNDIDVINNVKKKKDCWPGYNGQSES